MRARRSEVFFGRGREVDQLAGVLEAAQRGNGATVLVAGEAGIGKTRLATELGSRARDAGFDVLVGRSIDLVGTELPYQPFVEALRPLGPSRPIEASAGSQLSVFEGALDVLSERAASTPVLIVLEDLHWADTSTLDLVVFLARHLDERRVLLLATSRVDEPASADRVLRLAEGVRRARSSLVIQLEPLDDEAIRDLLAARADGRLAPELSTAIVARSEGNPFFAEELAAASEELGGALPRGLRDVLLRGFARLDRSTQSLLRLAAAAGRDVGYPLLRATAELSEGDVRTSLREAVEHGVLLADQVAGTFRFRHALLAEAIYATILPGEREELHGRLADELSSSGAASPAELAPHWAVAGRRAEALVASVGAARQAQDVFGLAEAFAHVRRAITLWETVPDPAGLVDVDLAELCSWAAELASQTGAAPHAVELVRRALELVGDGDPKHAALLYLRLGRYLFESGRGDEFLAACERAVEIVPRREPSVERAQALAALANGLLLVWRFDESMAICEEALEQARSVGADDVEARALTTLGGDLAYLGRADEGLTVLEQAVESARRIANPPALQRAYISLSDVLAMLGRPAESARIAAIGLAAIRPYGEDHTVLASNWIEALLATGEWDQADDASAAALRAISANYPHMPLGQRADLEIGRGDFDGARAHLDAALPTVRHEPGLAMYHGYVAELALWERRWTDADEAIGEGLDLADPAWGAQLRTWLCAKGLRASAELAAVARARQDAGTEQQWLRRARSLITAARRAAAAASVITPNAGGWLALAEAEYQRTRGASQPELWADAAATWDSLQRPPVAAYCRWRQCEALVADSKPRIESGQPLQAAYAVATRIGARPLVRELELLARRARLDLVAPREPEPDHQQSLAEALGLTGREVEVLDLVARGYTNREIAATLVISAKTASVHVSHILRKLGAPNRTEAAAIAHRLAPPFGGEAQRGA